jgi:3-phosphoshikimate 1-carboxyvinyltransferase
MDRSINACSRLRGEVVPPGDKSISHRALILNSIAEGKAKIDNLAPGEDVRATITCLQALGVDIVEKKGLYIVSGAGPGGFSEPQDVLYAGNSGTTTRLVTGLLAAQPFLSVITGDESMRSRPMARLIQPLRQMGADIWGRGNDSLAPLAIRGGKLKGMEYRLPVASAQIKSAILIAALFAKGKTTVIEPAPSRDHTERMMKSMGVNIRKKGVRVDIVPSAPRSPIDVRVPGDLSSAAFWLVAGAIHPDAKIKVVNTGVNPTRSGIIEVLQGMGARITVEWPRNESGEPVADIVVESSELVGKQIRGKLIPRIIDELPLIALAGAFARGTTTIMDAQELRVKESDRIGATVRELARLGIDIEELPDGMVIRGGQQPVGGECSSHRDHRLAMTLGIAALVARGETVIHDAEAVDVSYPNFWQDMERLSMGKGD